jgi:hypothetical protein
VLRVVRIERRSVLVEAVDLDELRAELPVPRTAVTDEDDLLAVAHVERPFVVTEHQVNARELRVALRVGESEDLDRLLDGAGAAAPAVVGRRSSRAAGRRRPVMFVPSKYFSTRMSPTSKPARAPSLRRASRRR